MSIRIKFIGSLEFLLFALPAGISAENFFSSNLANEQSQAGRCPITWISD